MSAQVLYGKEIAKEIRSDLKDQVQNMKDKESVSIQVAVIRIGDFEDAKLYAASIERSVGKVGIIYKSYELSESIGLEDAQAQIREIALNHENTGALLLSPVPKHLNYSQLLAAIPVDKDAEGSRYRAGDSGAYPPTALAILELILASKMPIEGKRAVVVGRSPIVGLPVVDLLIKNNATVTICHSRTTDLQSHISTAEILVSAVGKPNLIAGDWVKKGAVVIDAGENVVNDKVVGDIDFEKALPLAGHISPVPGGVGPVTPLMLIKNLITLSKAKK